jgi:hypothetical protein
LRGVVICVHQLYIYTVRALAVMYREHRRHGLNLAVMTFQLFRRVFYFLLNFGNFLFFLLIHHSISCAMQKYAYLQEVRHTRKADASSNAQIQSIAPAASAASSAFRRELASLADQRTQSHSEALGHGNERNCDERTILCKATDCGSFANDSAVHTRPQTQHQPCSCELPLSCRVCDKSQEAFPKKWLAQMLR